MIKPKPDPLRLSFCPACGYALDGLPDVGRCPECGGSYDATGDLILLRAWRSDQARQLITFAVLALASALWFAGRGSHSGPAPMLAGILGTILAMECLARAAAPWRNPLLLWLTADGLAITATLPRDSMAGRVRRMSPWLMGGGVLAWLWWRPTPGVAAGLVGCLILLVWTRTSAQQPLSRQQAGPPVPAGTPLIPLAHLTTIRLTPLRHPRDRHRLVAERRWTGRTPLLVRIDVELPPTVTVADLLARLDRWRSPLAG